jgi:hypothetical protein
MRQHLGLSLALAAAVCLCSVPASALPIFVDQNAAYRALYLTGAQGATPANWYAVGFNDSAWAAVNGPFSSAGYPGTLGADLGNVNGPFAPGPTVALPATSTPWAVNNDPFLRTSFTLAAPTALTIWIAVDNGINALYLNGVSTTATFNAEGQAFRWEHVLDVPASYTFAGTNLIAIQLEDHGGATAFDMIVTADDAAINPTFTENPPPTGGPAPVPEPATMTLLGLGLAAGGLYRRRQTRLPRE